MRLVLLVAPFAVAGIVVGGVNPPAPGVSCSAFIEQEALPADRRSSAGKPRLTPAGGISKLTHNAALADAAQATDVTFVKERDPHVKSRGVDGVGEFAAVGVAPSRRPPVAPDKLL